MNSGPTEQPLQTSFHATYTIERELGRGGMATVYLARDRKHERRVAVKVLHADLAAVVGSERFLQEIRVTATLQHPHILGLIDSGVFGDDAGSLRGRPYYVMPFVQGESLRDRLTREGQLSVSDAVRLASEVASALDYAHRQRVIHRDIKPENILLHDGSALVADFGIALAVQQAGGVRLTQTGLSLGTPQYMSPEQAMGERTITARTDIYALGVVTYEMLAGEPPFTGPTVQAIVARLMAEAPRTLSVQRRTVPPHVDAAVLQALEKLPADRFATAAEFAAALKEPSVAKPRTAVSPSTGRPRWLSWLPWTIAAAAVAFAAVASARPDPSRRNVTPRRVDILLPAHGAWEDDIHSSFTLSPDGSLLAYNGLDSTGQRRLFIRAMSSETPRPIPGSETAHYPSFSTDGRWVAFILNSRLVKAPVSGGTPEPMCEIGRLAPWVWLENGDAVVIDEGGVKQCSAGKLTIVLPRDSSEAYQYPHALPGGRHVLVTVRRDAESRLAVLDLPAKTVRRLGVLGSDARYVDSGRLVYASDDGLVRAVAFDADAIATSGEPSVVAGNVHVDGLGRAFMAVSRSGTIVAPPASAFQRALVLVDRGGRPEPVYPTLGDYSGPRFAPNGRRIALAIGPSIWQLDRNQGTLTRVSFDTGAAERPAWTPDGARLGYVRRLESRNDLRIINADGSGAAQNLLADPTIEPWHVLFSRDDAMLVRIVAAATRRDILRVRLDSARQREPLLASTADEVSPSLSPDGRWLAYASNESGRYEVYVRLYPGMGARHQVSLDGGTEPVWSPRGNEIFYRHGRTLMSAELRVGAAVEVARRTTLFDVSEYDAGATYQNYDVAPDGQQFVMIRNVAGPNYLTVLLDTLARSPTR